MNEPVGLLMLAPSFGLCTILPPPFPPLLPWMVCRVPSIKRGVILHPLNGMLVHHRVPSMKRGVILILTPPPPAPILDGMLVHHKVAPALQLYTYIHLSRKSQCRAKLTAIHFYILRETKWSKVSCLRTQHIYTTGWRETIWSKVSCLRTQHIYTPGWKETMWSKVSCLRTQHIYTPGWRETMWSRVSYLRAQHIYTPGWRETMWSKVSCLRTQHIYTPWVEKDNGE